MNGLKLHYPGDAGYVFELMSRECGRQSQHVELIASENFVSENVLAAMGSVFTNKYAEGYPAQRDSGNTGRYYGGCQWVDELERYCCTQWQKVFNTGYHVNVQPHSGSNANLAAYQAIERARRRSALTVLALSLDNGGHLTHGSKVNFSGRNYEFHHYALTHDGFIDYDGMQELADKYRPDVILAGASAYSREIDFNAFRIAADRVGATLMVDMAHIAGLVAAGLHCSPFGLADIITTTTHKTLRGPRGGMIFCVPALAKHVDSAVFPGTQGGPMMHIIAAKAVAACEALAPEFKQYMLDVTRNASSMATRFKVLGDKVVTGGTDNHMFLLDLSGTPVTGLALQTALEKLDITLNKNAVPGDKRSPRETSGVRIGTAAMTSRGWIARDFCDIADAIHGVLQDLQQSTT